MQKGYLVADSEVANSLEEVAQLLGVGEVTEEDITGDGQYADIVSVIDLADEGGTEGTTVTAENIHQAGGGVATEDVKTMSDEEFENTPMRLEIDDEAKEDLADLSFDTVDEIKEFIKDLDTPTLEAWAKALEVEWIPNQHANIERMRIAMAIKGHYFPELAPKKTEGKKKKAKYGDFSTQQLIKMATDNKVGWHKTGNEAIDRMRVIMALKSKNVL